MTVNPTPYANDKKKVKKRMQLSPIHDNRNMYKVKKEMGEEVISLLSLLGDSCKRLRTQNLHNFSSFNIILAIENNITLKNKLHYASTPSHLFLPQIKKRDC